MVQAVAAWRANVPVSRCSEHRSATCRLLRAHSPGADALPPLSQPDVRFAAKPPLWDVEASSDKGHDAFLLDEPDFHRTLAGFSAGCAVHAGLER